MVRAQGGDPDAAPAQARERHLVRAATSGYLTRLDARGVGVAAWRLGAGRARKEDDVSPSAGVVCLAKPGAAVEEGQPLLELHADEPGRFARALEALSGAIDIGPEPAEEPPLVLERIAP
jgi:thymidine phosphorylase